MLLLLPRGLLRDDCGALFFSLTHGSVRSISRSRFGASGILSGQLRFELDEILRGSLGTREEQEERRRRRRLDVGQGRDSHVDRRLGGPECVAGQCHLCRYVASASTRLARIDRA
jgi:hypothetical protein